MYEEWLIPRAKELFDDAIEMGWDEKNQGLFMALHQMVMFAIQINIFGFRLRSIAAAALLAQATNDKYYWDWYDRIWSFSWKSYD